MGATGALMAFQGVMTAIQGVNQSKAQKAEGQFKSNVYENNAKIADAQAADAIARGDQAAAQHKTQVKKLIGSQRASLASQGIEVNSGSAAEVQTDTAGLGAMDELTIKNNAWREAWGFRVQADDYRTSGDFAKLSANNQARNTILTAGMNITSDAAQGYYLSQSKVKASDGAK